MKFVLFFGVFLSVYSIALSALSRYPPPPEGKPGYCWSEPTGPMEKGEEKGVTGMCAKATCNNEKDIQVETCGVIVGLDGERVTLNDTTRPYPTCCFPQQA